MSEPIKVGDLVVMVRMCCHRCAWGKFPAVFGVPFRVAEIVPEYRHCGYCGSSWGAWWARAGSPIGLDCGCSTVFLKRIPPLYDLEGEKRDERITA